MLVLAKGAVALGAPQAIVTRIQRALAATFQQLLASELTRIKMKSQTIWQLRRCGTSNYWSFSSTKLEGPFVRAVRSGLASVVTAGLNPELRRAFWRGACSHVIDTLDIPRPFNFLNVTPEHFGQKRFLFGRELLENLELIFYIFC